MYGPQEKYEANKLDTVISTKVDSTLIVSEI